MNEKYLKREDIQNIYWFLQSKELENLKPNKYLKNIFDFYTQIFENLKNTYILQELKNNTINSGLYVIFNLTLNDSLRNLKKITFLISFLYFSLFLFIFLTEQPYVALLIIPIFFLNNFLQKTEMYNLISRLVLDSQEFTQRTSTS